MEGQLHFLVGDLHGVLDEGGDALQHDADAHVFCRHGGQLGLDVGDEDSFQLRGVELEP